MTDIFFESLMLHQRLVEVILDNADENGVCKLSQAELGKIVGRSQRWVSKAIHKINSEEICIEYKRCRYRALYPEIYYSSVFSTILSLYTIMAANPEVYFLSSSEIAKRYEIPYKTVQRFKSYVHTSIASEQNRFTLWSYEKN